MIVDYINGREKSGNYGTAKYSNEISKRMPEGLLNRIEYPVLYPSKIIDGFTRRYIYSFIVKRRHDPGHIHHITNQDLAFLLTEIDLPHSIVTCYDLIPWVFYKNRSRYWQKNIEGLRKAEKIITISEFSKREMIKHVGIPQDRIDVIYCGVDTNVFYPERDRTPLSKFGIGPHEKVLLYVGSEEPRKNLKVLLEAVAILREKITDIVLLKAGSPGMGGDRRATIRMMRKLRVEDRVFFTGDVTERMLAKLYNAADIFVFPSLYEGFGLPVIEAMACGCPVVASGTTSIPEIVEDAAILVDPSSPKEIAESVFEILSREEKRREMIERGLVRISRFDWNEATAKTLEVYENVISRKAG